VEARTPDGQLHSVLLQNAETVRLVGPGLLPAAAEAVQQEEPSAPLAAEAEATSGGSKRGAGGADSAAGADKPGSVSWRAVAVAALRPGDAVYVHQQAAARHTGVAVREWVREC
jgi:3-dehydroquinate synthase class II